MGVRASGRASSHKLAQRPGLGRPTPTRPTCAARPDQPAQPIRVITTAHTAVKSRDAITNGPTATIPTTGLLIPINLGFGHGQLLHAAHTTVLPSVPPRPAALHSSTPGHCV
jgi:hypothetical protein